MSTQPREGLLTGRELSEPVAQGRWWDPKEPVLTHPSSSPPELALAPPAFAGPLPTVELSQPLPSSQVRPPVRFRLFLLTPGPSACAFGAKKMGRGAAGQGCLEAGPQWLGAWGGYHGAGSS